MRRTPSYPSPALLYPVPHAPTPPSVENLPVTRASPRHHRRRRAAADQPREPRMSAIRLGRAPCWAPGTAVVLGLSGCAFHGLNSLPLPGAAASGPDAAIYHVEIASVSTLESNSPVMIGDVAVGSVGKMTFQSWHADVEIRVKPGTVIPANVVATVGQTSLLGSMHLELNPPVDQPPRRRCHQGPPSD